MCSNLMARAKTSLGAVAIALLAVSGIAAQSRAPVGDLVQYGEMHEAIGQQQHQGRIGFAELTQRPHFYAVAALAGLSGEATVVDGKLFVTSVDEQGNPKPVAVGAQTDLQATMLVGAYVEGWRPIEVDQDISAERLDGFIEQAAEAAGMDTSRPFMFVLQGDFSQADLHVINGACPIHARLKRIDLPSDKLPFVATVHRVKGTVVGVFAKDAVGKLTHPATSTHMHLVYQSEKAESPLTAHLEGISVQAGAKLMLGK